jgi:hypothetical protein
MSSTLYAVDGVILIDQQRAMAGNVTPGDAPGFPVTISVPGSYRLSGNLTVPDSLTTGIHVTADFVTVDLNGFGIIGPVTCTPNPTVCTTTSGGVGLHAGDFNVGTIAPKGVKVMNGTVRGMGFHGVRMQGAGTVVERVITISNGGPGIVVGGSVKDCVAHLNGGTGIIAHTVRGSSASQNRQAGMFIRQTGLVSDSDSNLNDGDGITVTTGVVAGNAVNSNKGFGISATCPSTITGNNVTANQSGNIQALGACVLANNSQ